MQKHFQGRAWTFGSNIDTDQIYPAKHLEHVDPAEIAKHCLEGADPAFASRVQAGDIVVAGTNFGCGSSREHAVITLQSAGVALVIAESFARIFYRNAINLALPVLVCPGVAGLLEDGDLLDASLESGEVKNRTKGKSLRAEPLSEHALNILESGGIKPMMLERLSKMNR